MRNLLAQMNFVPISKTATFTSISLGRKPLDLTGDNDADGDYFESNVRLLQPEESYAFAFMSTTRVLQDGVVSSTPANNPRAAIGRPEVRWCTTMGEFSLFRAEDTTLKGSLPPSATSSGNSSAVKVQCVSSPSEARVGEVFDVRIRVSNASARPMTVRLQCLNSTSSSSDVYYSSGNTGSNSAPSSTSGGNTTSTRFGGPMGSPANINASNTSTAPASLPCLGLCVTGLTYYTLGNLGPGESTETSISVCALCAGLHDLTGVFAVDSVTKQRYSSDSLCKVFVVDSDDEEEDEEGATDEEDFTREKEKKVESVKVQEAELKQEFQEDLEQTLASTDSPTALPDVAPVDGPAVAEEEKSSHAAAAVEELTSVAAHGGDDDGIQKLDTEELDV